MRHLDFLGDTIFVACGARFFLQDQILHADENAIICFDWHHHGREDAISVGAASL